jgi:hypothetical protein
MAKLSHASTLTLALTHLRLLLVIDRADRLHQHRSWSSSPTTIYIVNIATSSPPSPLMVIVNANKQLYFFY